MNAANISKWLTHKKNQANLGSGLPSANYFTLISSLVLILLIRRTLAYRQWKCMQMYKIENYVNFWSRCIRKFKVDGNMPISVLIKIFFYNWSRIQYNFFVQWMYVYVPIALHYFIKIIQVCTLFWRNSVPISHENLPLEMRRLPVIGESNLNIVINKSIFGKHARNVFSWIWLSLGLEGFRYTI